MRTYYIVFEQYSSEGVMMSWAIRNTENNLDTVMGLLEEIEALEHERNASVLLLSWRELYGGVV